MYNEAAPRRFEDCAPLSPEQHDLTRVHKEKPKRPARLMRMLEGMFFACLPGESTLPPAESRERLESARQALESSQDSPMRPVAYQLWRAFDHREANSEILPLLHAGGRYQPCNGTSPNRERR